MVSSLQQCKGAMKYVCTMMGVGCPSSYIHVLLHNIMQIRHQNDRF